MTKQEDAFLQQNIAHRENLFIHLWAIFLMSFFFFVSSPLYKYFRVLERGPTAEGLLTIAS